MISLTSHLITLPGFSPKVVPPSGNGSSGILLIGEAPGDLEDRFGVPFYDKAPAGATLEKVLRRIGISRDQLTLANTVWQRPPNNWLDGAPWEREAVETWREPLDDLINRVRPKVIVPLGNVALRRFTPYGGKKTSITWVANYVIPSSTYGCWVVPGPHPSWIVRGQQDEITTLIFTIKRALEIAQKGFEPAPVRYITRPMLKDMLEFEAGYDPSRHPLMFDIETPESQDLDEEEMEDEDISYTIIRASACYGDRHAISFPWQEPFVTVAKRMLGSEGEKGFWNGRRFDVPRLEYNNAPVRGKIIDWMDLWKHLQPTLRKGLGYVSPMCGWDLPPWKHESGAEPEFYSAADADATFRCAVGIERGLRSLNLWESCQRHVIELSDVLSRMSKNGLPVDPDKLREKREELQILYDERFSELQGLIPDHLKPTDGPKEGYRKPPKEVQGIEGWEGLEVGGLLLAVDGTRWAKRVYTELAAIGESLEEHPVERWTKIAEFLPKSTQQVQAYAKSKGHKLGTNRKTKKETTDADTLRKLYKRHKDEVYRLILECRNIQDYVGRYVNGWKPGSDNHVHPTPGFWGKMYRISWRKPNIGATVADKNEEAIAKGFRGCVKAPAGHMIVEADFSGVEAVLVGYLADDPDYIRLARLGVHAFMAGMVLHTHGRMQEPPSTSWSDADLVQYKRMIKKNYPKEYDDAKHGCHLSAYLGTPRLMTAMFPESWPRERDAREWQGLFFSTIAKKVRKWQERTIEQAHRQGFLTLPYGYRMWFWDVCHWNSKTQRMEVGDEAKSAVSFVPRDSAAFILRDTLLRLRSWTNEGILRACVHDSIVGIPPIHRVDEFASALKREMERPIPELNGLVINTEIKVGPDWGEGMEEWRG